MDSRETCVRRERPLRLGDTVVPVHEVVAEYAGGPSPEGAPSRWAHATCVR